jgi:hypothetical protein
MMSMTSLHQMAVIPAFLLTLGALLLLRGLDDEAAARRLLRILPAAGVLLLASALLAHTFLSSVHLLSNLPGLLAPLVWGILTLVALNITRLPALPVQERRLVLAGLLLMFILMGLLWRFMLGFAFFLVPGLLLLLLGWKWGRQHPRWLIGLGMGAFLYYFIGFQMVYGPLPRLGATAPLVNLFGLMPALLVVLAALLFYRVALPRPATGASWWASGWWASGWWARGATLLLAVSLLASLAYAIFWGSVWDQTSDGLFGVFVAQPNAVLALVAGMVVAFGTTGRGKVAGVLFMLLAPLLLLQAFEAGWRVSYHEITEDRAERIAAALDQYRAREGRYPASLSDLTPRDLRYIQQPIILRAETWCYEAGDDHYRLAAFYREFFSSPVSLRLYAAAGEPPDGPWTCQEREAEVAARYFSPMSGPAAMPPPPLPTPLPPGEVAIARTPLEPLLDGLPVAAGSWSPDSRYFFFGTQTEGLRLAFLEGQSGQLCPVEAAFGPELTLRERHAWLPDGRLLYLDVSGELALLTPCQPEVDWLTDRFPLRFDQIEAAAPENGRILLQNAAGFWIVDGRSFTLTPIPDVAPNGYDLHWDRAAWLPGGERLVISRLDGRRGSNAGSTLFLVNGTTGQIEGQQRLPGDFGQSAPWVSGLGEGEIILHGHDDLYIVELQPDSFRFTAVFADILELNVNYPQDLSGHAVVLDEEAGSYYLVTRLNQRHNQNTYLYHAGSGQLHVYQHDQHSLILFANGQSVYLTKRENEPAYRDEYAVILAAEPDIAQPRLHLSGHVPRENWLLHLTYLPQTSQIVAASAQGISLVSLLDSEMVAFWTLAGDGFGPWLSVAPDGSTFVAVRDYGGLYGPLP